VKVHHYLLLYGIPKYHKSALLGSIFVSVSAILCLLTWKIGMSLDFLSWVYSALYAVHIHIAMRCLNYNIFAVFRYVLLWSLGAIAALTRAIWQGEVFLGPFGIEYQTDSNLVIILTAGLLGISGSLIGWNRSLSSRFRQIFDNNSLYFSKHQNRLLLAYGYSLALGAGLVYLWGSGGVVGENKVYGSESGDGLGFEFNILNIFHFVGISLILLAAAVEGKFSKQALLIAMVSLVFGMLAGSRADYLPQLLILMLFLANKKINVYISSEKISATKFIVFGLIGSIIFFLLATLIAYKRQGFPVIEFVQHTLNTGRGLINEIYGHPVLFFETGNMMIGGFYAAIVNAKNDGFLLGGSYIDYVLRSPPAFLGLDRPAGLDTLTLISGQIMAQGGIFELAEAYWNFGLIGCFFVPLMISFIHGSLLRKAILRNSAFLFMCYLVPGFMAFRAVWYQNFSYFRQFTVLLIIFIVMYFFARWLLGQRQRNFDQQNALV
jgi:hypothetical protein